MVGPEDRENKVMCIFKWWISLKCRYLVVTILVYISVLSMTVLFLTKNFRESAHDSICNSKLKV